MPPFETLEDSIPRVPQPKKRGPKPATGASRRVTVSVSIRYSVASAIRTKARDTNRTMSNLVETLLEEGLDKMRRDQKKLDRSP